MCDSCDSTGLTYQPNCKAFEATEEQKIINRVQVKDFQECVEECWVNSC